MKPSWKLLLCAPLCVVVMTESSTAQKRGKPTAEQIETWATCAVEKNAADVKWIYIIRSDQSGLKGPSLYGTYAYTALALTRDCVPDSVARSRELFTPLETRAIAIWNGDKDKQSLARAIDPWADCMASNHRQKSSAYLSARDFEAASGPKLIVNGEDPVDAFFAPTEQCQALAPASRDAVEWTDLYSRLNYRLRVEPRFQAPAAEAAAGVSDA